jgi:hypothetical protein
VPRPGYDFLIARWLSVFLGSQDLHLSRPELQWHSPDGGSPIEVGGFGSMLAIGAAVGCRVGLGVGVSVAEVTSLGVGDDGVAVGVGDGFPPPSDGQRFRMFKDKIVPTSKMISISTTGYHLARSAVGRSL